MSFQFTAGRFKGWASDNTPLAGGRLYTYASGTTTHKAAYTDATLGAACTYVSDGVGGLYIELDARGEADVWWGPGAYSWKLTDSSGVQIDAGDGERDPSDAAKDYTDTLRSDLAASSGSSMVGFIQSGAGAVARTLQDKVRDVVNVRDNGARGDGVTDDTAAIQAAINSGVCLLPSGNFRVTASLTIPYGAVIVGAGRGRTTITSEVIGAPLFKPANDNVAFVTMSDMKLAGNGLTGVGGNGHALSLIDPVSGGSWTPQNSTFERLWITGFKGQYNIDRGTTKVMASGVMAFQALQCVFNQVFVGNCGHGFLMYDTQNCRLVNCAGDGNTKYTLFAYSNDNLIVSECDFVDSGDGIEDAGYPEPGLLSGIVGSFKNSGFVFRDSKVKNNRAGKAVIVSKYSNGDVFRDNWIRGDVLTDIAHKAMYAERSPGIVIDGNTFSPAVSNYAIQKYEGIELFNNQTNETMIATITDNTFEDVSGQNIAYNVKVGGNSSSRSMQVKITGNQFGDNTSSASATTIDADIIVDQCALDASEIRNNLHYAVTNVTRTAGVAVSSTTLTKSTIGPNKFSANGGTITNQYTGVSESEIVYSEGWNPASLADGARETKAVTVTGAAIGDTVQASLGVSLQNVDLTAYVSAANTVTCVLTNRTGGVVDLASSSLTVRVKKAWSA